MGGGYQNQYNNNRGGGYVNRGRGNRGSGGRGFY